jgi:four helix bundle protein
MANNKNKKYDLEERTAKFGEEIIELCKSIPKTIITESIIKQLIRSATSVGANYCEADCAESRKDFEHKLAISKKEAKETKHWLRMLAKTDKKFQSEARELWKEANELQLIFITIINKSKANNLKDRIK